METQAVSTVMSQGVLAREDPILAETCDSACQLQLARLSHQLSVSAAWLIYWPESGLQYQVVTAKGPDSRVGLADFLLNDSTLNLEASDLDPIHDFLEQANRVALEIKADLWEFSLCLPSNPQIALVGVKFQDLITDKWIYLILERNSAGDDLRNLPQLLQPELELLRAAIKLDHKYDHQRQQTEQYQKILRRIEHQLRNPLAIIHLYAANLHSSLQQETDRHQAAAIGEAVHHLSNHLTDMIAGCQRTELERHLCSIPALWTEAWQGLQLMAQATRVQLSFPSQPLQIEGDRAQLLQVFENLLHNALCFSPPQGQINLHWQGFCHETLITIADQGPGLSATDLQQMFRPYYSNRPQGSGLGLTIAHQIVAAHGGKLWANNLPTGGAQFSIVLPRHAVAMA